MAKDAALGMNWLHCNNPTFIHRDLKSSNLLMDEKLKVKVCDFGLSQVKEHGTMLKDEDLARGTPLWMAPEVMEFKEFNEKADVYSFGIVLWEFLTRQEPFANHKNYTKFKRAVCAGERPPIPPDCEPSLRSLIEDCWTGVPANRPSFKTIISRLESVIVDVAIKDALGRQFWKNNFLGKEEVKWSAFAKAFDDFLALPDDDELPPADAHRVNLNLRCLKAILVEKPVKGPGGRQGTLEGLNVSIESFGDLLEWVGPITDPATTPINKTVLDTIRELMEHPWFHGDVDTQTAQDRLSGRPGGTFLVRFSSIAGWYTVSQITPNRVILHQRIRHSPGSAFTIDNESYASLQQLVTDRHLDLACDGSRFISLTRPPRDQGYIGIV